MEGFIISIIALVGFIGFSVISLVVFFLMYYLYLRGTVKGKNKSKDKRLGKGF